MKSRITIDLDYDNQPIIKVEYTPSPDVRDSMVKRFLEKFGGESSWAKMTYTQYASLHSNGVFGAECIAQIRPICNHDLPEESKVIAEQARLHQGMRIKLEE